MYCFIIFATDMDAAIERVKKHLPEDLVKPIEKRPFISNFNREPTNAGIVVIPWKDKTEPELDLFQSAVDGRISYYDSWTYDMGRVICYGEEEALFNPLFQLNNFVPPHIYDSKQFPVKGDMIIGKEGGAGETFPFEYSEITEVLRPVMSVSFAPTKK